MDPPESRRWSEGLSCEHLSGCIRAGPHRQRRTLMFFSLLNTNQKRFCQRKVVKNDIGIKNFRILPWIVSRGQTTLPQSLACCCGREKRPPTEWGGRPLPLEDEGLMKRYAVALGCGASSASRFAMNRARRSPRVHGMVCSVLAELSTIPAIQRAVLFVICLSSLPRGPI